MNQTKTVEIVPTCVPRDPRELAACVQKIRGFSHTIHLDIDDGVFTSAMTWPYSAAGVFSDSAVTLQPFAGMDVHVHLMVKSPRNIGISFSRAGASSIIGHIESFDSLHEAEEIFGLWRKSGALEVGCAILLDTSLSALDALFGACDFIHVMTIAAVGTQGLPYDVRGIERVRELHARHPHVIISVDGGESESNIPDIVHAGASRFAIGSAIMKDPDPAAAYARLKKLIENTLQ